MHEYALSIAPFIRRPENIYKEVRVILERRGHRGQLGDLTEDFEGVAMFNYLTDDPLGNGVIEELNSLPGLNVKKT